MNEAFKSYKIVIHNTYNAWKPKTRVQVEGILENVCSCPFAFRAYVM